MHDHYSKINSVLHKYIKIPNSSSEIEFLEEVWIKSLNPITIHLLGNCSLSPKNGASLDRTYYFGYTLEDPIT